MFDFGPRRSGRRGVDNQLHQLEDSSWTRYFDRLADRAGPCLVAVEVVACPDDPVGARKRRLRGIAYDAVTDVIEIAVGDRAAGDALSVRHLIADPRTITVRDTAAAIEIVIVDATRVQTRIDLLPTARSALSRRRLRGDASLESLIRRPPRTRRVRGNGCPPARGCRQVGRRLRGFHGKPSVGCG